MSPCRCHGVTVADINLAHSDQIYPEPLSSAFLIRAKGKSSATYLVGCPVHSCLNLALMYEQFLSGIRAPGQQMSAWDRGSKIRDSGTNFRPHNRSNIFQSIGVSFDYRDNGVENKRKK